jgi:hypothetical protein
MLAMACYPEVACEPFHLATGREIGGLDIAEPVKKIASNDMNIVLAKRRN